MIRISLLLIAVSLFTACRTPEALVLQEKLKALPEWVTVRKAAQAALAKNESTSLGWGRAMAVNDTGAIYPIRKEGEVWLVHACDDYPMNRYGVVVEMEISSNGDVRRYTQLWKQKKQANQALQHNDPSCHVSCLRTPRASRGRG